MARNKITMNQSAINNLRNVLADLYTDGASTRRIALDVGLDISRIEFGSNSVVVNLEVSEIDESAIK